MTGLALHLDHTDGTHGGSDHRDFARAGVPLVRFFGNFFPASHEPGDTPDTLDATQVQRVARLALATAWLLAGRLAGRRPGRPSTASLPGSGCEQPSRHEIRRPAWAL